MQWLTWAFLVAVAAETLTRLWLASRQIAAVRRIATRAGAVSRADRARRPAEGGRLHRRAGAARALGDGVSRRWSSSRLTLGGGLAAVDDCSGDPGLAASRGGARCVVASCCCCCSWLGLPFSLWRTFRIEARFGFNRDLAAAVMSSDLAKQLVLGLLLGGPLVLATLALMERAGAWWWIVGVARSGWVWTLGLTWAAPRFIAPLFNRFSPLDG